jgi:hypothetical protein
METLVLPDLIERVILFLAICICLSASAAFLLRPPAVDSKSRARAMRFLLNSKILAYLSLALAMCFSILHFVVH